MLCSLSSAYHISCSKSGCRRSCNNLEVILRPWNKLDFGSKHGDTPPFVVRNHHHSTYYLDPKAMGLTAQSTVWALI